VLVVGDSGYRLGQLKGTAVMATRIQEVMPKMLGRRGLPPKQLQRRGRAVE
jgi:hypothetical protein